MITFCPHILISFTGEIIRSGSRSINIAVVGIQNIFALYTGKRSRQTQVFPGNICRETVGKIRIRITDNITVVYIYITVSIAIYKFDIPGYRSNLIKCLVITNRAVFFSISHTLFCYIFRLYDTLCNISEEQARSFTFQEDVTYTEVVAYRVTIISYFLTQETKVRWQKSQLGNLALVETNVTAYAPLPIFLINNLCVQREFNTIILH